MDRHGSFRESTEDKGRVRDRQLTDGTVKESDRHFKNQKKYSSLKRP